MWENTTLTNKGILLQAKILEGRCAFNITKCITGANSVAAVSLRDQTSVTTPMQTATLQPFERIDNEVTIPVLISNIGLAVGYNLWQIGFYAIDPDEGEILYAIAQISQAKPIPSHYQSKGYTLVVKFKFTLTSETDVEVAMDPAGLVTIGSFNELKDSVSVMEARVDRLAPSKKYISETVSVDDSSGLPFVDMRLYGKSVQDGVATPENPVDIKSVGEEGSVEIRVHGKNLFPVEPAKVAGVEISRVDDYFVLNGTAESSYNFIYSIGYLPAGTYTISAKNPKNSGVYYGLVDIHSGNTQQTLQAYDNVNNTKMTGVIEEAYDFVGRIRVENGVTYDNFIIKPQLEMSPVETEYEPYKKQSIVVATGEGLHGIAVESGGTYTDENWQQWVCDEIDLARGVYVKRIAAVDMSSLTWAYSVNWWQATIADMKYVKSNTEYGAAMAENYHIRVATGMTLAVVGEFAIDTTNIKVVNGSIEEKPNGLLLYQLAEPIETPLSSEEIAAFKELTTNNPNTVILNDGGAVVKVDYVTATHEPLVDMLLKRIAALENALGGLNFVALSEGAHDSLTEYGDNTIYFTTK